MRSEAHAGGLPSVRSRIGRLAGVDTWLAGAIGSALGLAVIVAAGQDGKHAAILLAGLVALGLAPLALAFPATAERVLLFGLALTLSVSLKFHPVYRIGHLGGAIGLRVSVTDVLLIALAGLWWAGRDARRPLRLSIDTPLLAAFGAFMAFAAISTLMGPDPALGVFQLAADVQAFLTFVFLVNAVTTPARFRAVLTGALIGLALQSAVALVQVERPGLVKLDALGAGEVAEREVGGEVDLPDVDRGTTTLEGEIRTRPMGLLIHPNILGVYFVLMIPVAIAVALAGPTLALRLLGLGAGGLGLAALLASLSRAGWFGLAAAGLVALPLALRWRALRLGGARLAVMGVAATAAAVALALKAPLIIARLTETASEAVEFRLALARTAMTMMAAHPFSGVGLNTFVHVAPAYDPTGMTRLRSFPVHDIFLLQGSETGVLGGVAFVVLVGVMLARAFTFARRCPSAGRRLLALALAGGLAGFWFADLSGFAFRIPIMTTLVWAQLALIFAALRTDSDPTA